jgi:transcriptional regulator with XRE-family HTH domain
MARPRTIVKNELSTAIVELRRRLELSQQAFANMLSLSLGAVARWELNQRPERELLKRLIDLANQNGFRDLEEVFYLEYRREFGLQYDVAVTLEIAGNLAFAINLLDGLPEPRHAEDRHSKEYLREILKRILWKVAKFPTDPADVRVVPPTETVDQAVIDEALSGLGILPKKKQKGTKQ